MKEGTVTKIIDKAMRFVARHPYLTYTAIGLPACFFILIGTTSIANTYNEENREE